ncbi:anne boleyn [Carabus blaptoides fortunei]
MSNYSILSDFCNYDPLENRKSAEYVWCKRHISQTIDQGEEHMEIYGYRPSFWQTLVTWSGYILTLGILRLVYHWYPHLGLKSTFKQCPLGVATKILIIDNFQEKYKTYFVKDIKRVSTCDISGTKSNSSGENLNHTRGKPRVSEDDSNSLAYRLEDGQYREAKTIRAFWVKKLCYIWDEKQEKFMRLVGLDKGVTNEEFHKFAGFNAKDQDLRRIIYGPNEITVPVQSTLTLLVLEALNPFYVFQVCTFAVWLADSYYYYLIAIVIMTVYGIATSIFQTRQFLGAPDKLSETKSQEFGNSNQLNLRGTVQSVEKVRVCRGDDVVEDIPSTELVPGDVLLVPAHGCTMPCDAVLLEGNCIVNESMLTGESVPVTKTALPQTNVGYDIKEDSNHTLYCGTKIIQTRFYGSENVRAVVIRTGYLTTKGQLVRSILYPPPADFKFDRDSYRFIGILALIAFVGFLYTVISKSSRGLSPFDIIIKALDIITIVVPPALPAAMTVGKLYAIGRLKKNKIYCMNSRVVNVTGSINCVCFDKTGTLTEDGLDMWGVVPVKDGVLGEAIKDARSLPERSPLLLGMVSCHSLTIIENQLSGDPLDVKMFESTGWTLEEPNVEDTAKYDLLVPTVVRPAESTSRKCSTVSELSHPLERQLEFEMGIVQQYQFSSTLQRMSVVTRILGSDQFEIYCKGSPEMIVSLSKPETVPQNLLSILKSYTEQGYRVIALGSRVLEESYLRISKMHRDELEKDLHFQGLIVLENQLKPETAGVIDTLKKAAIKVVMITGDNIQTALSVARECGIVSQGDKILDTVVVPVDKTGGVKIEFHETGIPLSIPQQVALRFSSEADLENSLQETKYHLAMTGKSWALAREYFPELIPKLATKGIVFARMSGEQKQQLVLELQNLGYYVAMCGDGANDCGALKAAHTGISLSEAESSVASPFTSTEANISCIPKVIREGRAALVTSFGVFKFMVAYSLTEFLSVIILYGIDSNLTNLQFLFIDICLVVNFASFFGKTSAYDGPLVKEPPMTSLLGFIPLMSLILFMVLTTVFQYTAYYVIQTFDWFTPFVYDSNDSLNFKSYENYAVFTVSLFQYITMAVVFSKGKPYREPFYSNLTFFTSLIIMTLVCGYITLYPANWILATLELKLPPKLDMPVVIIAMAFVNFVVCLIVESFLVEYVLHKKIRPWYRNIEKSSKKYLKLEQDLQDTAWLTAPTFSNISFPTVGNGTVKYESETKHGVANGNFDNPESITTKL